MANPDPKYNQRKVEPIPPGDHTILTQLDQALWVSDQDGKLIYWNENFESVFKKIFKTDIHAGINLKAVVSEWGKLADLIEKLESLPEQQDKSYSTIRAIQLADENYYLKLDFYSFNTDTGFSGLVGVASEIDENVIYEKTMNDQGQLFKNLTDNLGIAVFAFDADFRFFYANKIALQLTGYSIEEFSKLKFPDIVHPDYREVTIKRARQRFNKKMDQKRYSIKILNKKGEGRWVDLTAAYMKIAGQDTIIGTAIDITARKKTEQQRDDSQRELLALMNNIPGITFRCKYDSHWTMQYLSKAFADVTGYEPEEVLENKKIAFDEIIHHDDRERVNHEVDQAIRDDRRYQIEYRIIRKSGEIRWVFEQGNAYSGTEGKIEFIEGIILDITNRKYAEEVQHVVGEIAKLSMEEVNFDNVEYFENVRQKIARLMNADHFSVIYYTRSSQELKLLYSSDKNIRRDLTTVHKPVKTLSYKVISEHIPMLLSRHEIKELEKNGKIINYGKLAYQWMGIPMELSGGNTGAVILQTYQSGKEYTHRDIKALEVFTQQIILAINRKDAINALSERENYYRNMYMNLPESYHSLDENGEIMVVNKKWLNMMGYERKAVLGKSFGDFFDEKSEVKFSTLLDELKKNGRTDNRQLKLKKKNGHKIEVVYTGQVEFDQMGNFLRTHCVFANITQIKQAENAMRLAKEKAEENDKLKSTFLANMSHEIRSPMNAILGFADLLKDPSFSEAKKKRFIQLIDERGNDLLRIIDDIIDISKLEAGSLKFSAEQIKLYEFLENLEVSFRQERKRQEKEDIYFIMERSKDLKNISFEVDPVRLRQILMNLFNNALKFTEKGYVKFEIERQNTIANFKVSDTGIGIPPDQKELIFERFRQVDMNFKSSRSGTGLGLSISRTLAEEMGGTLEVDSTEGQGSRFSLKLPMKNMKEGRERPETQQEQSYEKPKQYAEKNLLIVEDDFHNYMFLKDALQDLKLNIHWAKDGDEALNSVQSVFTPDLILMDIRLPGINGLELTKTIKDRYPDIYVVAQTAFARPEDKQEATKAGCDDFIAKPISRELLVAVVSKYLDKT